jgi:hypothetical protein
MKLTKSDLILKEKPNKNKVGLIKKSITNVKLLNSIDDLERIVLTNPFNVSESSGTTESDWLSQQIFALDFDSGITIEEVERRAQKNSLEINLLYTTLSDSDALRKFRVIFCLEKPITEYKRAKWIQKGLMTLFPEADAACKDLCRMYYPGKQIIIKNETLNDNVFFETICLVPFDKNGRFFNNFDYPEYKDKVINEEKIKNYNWDKAIKEIKLLDLFFNNNVRLSYSILVGLMLNAEKIYGGKLKILNRMKEINDAGGGLYFPYTPDRGIEKYPVDYFKWNHLSKYNYEAAMLKNFSPFLEDEDYHNLLELQLKRGEIEILERQKQISIQDATQLMTIAFSKSVNNEPFKITYDKIDMITGETKPNIEKLDPIFNLLPENPIYIFKITTGLGKTETYLNETNSLIALPRHKLKDEVSNRMKVTHKITPETPIFSNDILNILIEQLRDSGLFTEVSDIMRKVQKGKVIINKENYEINNIDSIKADMWVKANDDCRRDDTTVLTTHKRAINDESFKHNIIIFDEDPLNDFIEIDRCLLDFSIFDNTNYKDFINSLENYLRNIPMDCVLDMPKFNTPKGLAKYTALKNKGHIIKLLHSDWIYKSSQDASLVHFCKKVDLPKDKKIFIMSATAPIPIYQKLYTDRVIVVDISNIKPIGVIEQYTKKSYSSSQMYKYNTYEYTKLFNKINNTKVITHAIHSTKVQLYQTLDNVNLTPPEDIGKNHGLYFGNCSGSDKLNGYDVSVVGTPHKPDYVYFFILKMIGASNSIDTTITNQIVDWNGFRFRFMTYASKDLRDIQLSLIESELLQAAGRSRFLRNNNTTKIFSSLPLKITTTFINN